MTPDYYQIPCLAREDGQPAQLGDIYDAHGALSVWACEAISHVYRAGRKPSETAEEAIESAITSLHRELERLRNYG